jgi:hypothetical protein
MRISRGKLLILVTAASMMLAFGAAVFAFLYDLPDPAQANRRQLFCWLIEKDLGQQPRQIRLGLANRLEEECCNGFNWQEVNVQLDDAQQNRLWNNIPLILQPWFAEKAKNYCKLTNERRQDYLDRLINTISTWRGIERLIPNQTVDSKGEKSSAGLANLLGKEIERLQQETNSPDREQIGELWNAIKLRWLVRNLTLSI